MNTQKLIINDDLITRHTEKLKYWFDLLNKVMPDYFFNTFTPQQIQMILPALFNIQRQTGIQQINTGSRIILIYLLSEECNLVTTSRMMCNHNVTGAQIHESREQIIIDGAPRTLVIETYETGDIPVRITPIYTEREVLQAYRKRYKQAGDGIKDLYNRLSWNSVRDLPLERLVERLHRALRVQGRDCIEVDVEKAESKEIRLTMAMANCPQKGFYHWIIECLARRGFHVNRAYLRDFSWQEDDNDFQRMPVAMHTLYLKADSPAQVLKSKRLRETLEEIRILNWIPMDDLLHYELVEQHGWLLPQANLIRAAGEFVHTQLSFIDRNAYNNHDVFRFMALYEPLLKKLFEMFETKFHPGPAKPETRGKKARRIAGQITKRIDGMNTGMQEKDNLVKTIFRALLNFFNHIYKTNFYVENKTALSFRLDPAFMSFFEGIATEYTAAFPEQRPFGVFYFYRENGIGFQVRFSEIARGGWRTVIPRTTGHELERMDSYAFAKDEIFREVYVLAHTQHMKNKDIYEGGSKMICLLQQADGFAYRHLYESQRSICRAFLDLINYDAKGKLKQDKVIDYLDYQEIIEIGPDENMYDVMINWMCNYSKETGYILGRGLISGSPETGINHKEYGVTSLGVHQYLLKTLRELEIDPAKDPFSVKISGGPFGDVAGNELKLLLEKSKGKYLYPNLKVVAITDGPAACWDPEGLDRDELERMIAKENLDKFAADKLKGEGAFIIYSEPKMDKGIEKYLMRHVRNGKLDEKYISRDEFMQMFQDNLMCHYADIFIPCGGRPSTINVSNWEKYFPYDKAASRAIIEGANSFITPDARDLLQDRGVWIVKDASANKCGVITSSYEILSGLILGEDELKKRKKELVKEIMEILKDRAWKEADWLFFHFRKTGKRMTELTEQLSVEINAKTSEISDYLGKHPELIRSDIILKHLPKLFSKLDVKLLERIPAQYRVAIVATELACRIVYNRTDNLGDEIASVL